MKPWPSVRLGEVLRRSEETIEPQAEADALAVGPPPHICALSGDEHLSSSH